MGTRGVGKTTILLQRLKELQMPPSEALYVDMGDIYFQENRLLDFGMDFVARGGKFLFLDEVHRYGYGTWAQEIKQLYDVYRSKLKITFTGSSAIQILKQKADLSRRALQYRIPGLSFREYLFLTQGRELPVLSYQDILFRHQELLPELLSDPEFTPLAALKTYLREGYYPIFLSEGQGYSRKLNEVIQLVLDSDIPSVTTSGNANYQKLSRLLFAIASSVPFLPNITKMASRLGIGRDTLLNYLKLLEKADLITNLQNEAKDIGALTKPDKIYLNNTNLLYNLAPNQVELGTIRETFFLNQLNYLRYEAHILPPEIRLPKQGDFVLLDKDDRYVFEIGDPKKSSKQIGTEPDHFVVTDTEITGSAHRIPLWLFGLLY
ncbi:MAG: putative AAA+ superfamily ATPase [Bdellovibrionota bacterium]